MGIIRAVTSSIGGGLADQWLESIVADNMGDTVVMAGGVKHRRNDKRNQNKKGNDDVISNGSVIQVEQNQCMLLVDGGKIVDYSAEPGYFTVNNSSAPSLFNGELEESVQDTFNRVRFGGAAPHSQKVFYINTQEIKNIPFGTVNPINYFDNFYNAELYLRCHGYFSVRVVDPLKFFAEAVPRNAGRVDFKDMNKLYLSEFLTALQTAINKMSVDGIRISHVTSKSMELADYMATVLDEDWTRRRGFLIESVGISSISYDEQSKKLIDMRNQGAMLSDASIREGYVQGSVARGIEAAGSNAKGAATGFMGVGMGMGQGGGFVAAASAANQAQIARDEAARPAARDDGGWTCACGGVSAGKFCPQCGKPKPEAKEGWICACGENNTGNFCMSCGQKRPSARFCPSCGAKVPGESKFCGECGSKVE